MTVLHNEIIHEIQPHDPVYHPENESRHHPRHPGILLHKDFPDVDGFQNIILVFGFHMLNLVEPTDKNNPENQSSSNPGTNNHFFLCSFIPDKIELSTLKL
jgi:hypothetical protein